MAVIEMVHSVNTNIFCFKIIQLLLNFEQQIYCHLWNLPAGVKEKLKQLVVIDRV